MDKKQKKILKVTGIITGIVGLGLIGFGLSSESLYLGLILFALGIGLVLYGWSK